MSDGEITDMRRVLTQKSTVAAISAAKEAEAKAQKQKNNARGKAEGEGKPRKRSINSVH